MPAVWINKLLIIFVCIFGFACSNPKQPKFNNEYSIQTQEVEYCAFSYRIAVESVLCSREAIDPSTVIRSIELTEKLYNSYTGITLEVSNLNIIILTAQEINDPALFPNVRTYSAAARYFPTANMLYITQDALQSGNSDLAHELVHHLNQKRGIKDTEEDERIAYSFEKQFGARF